MTNLLRLSTLGLLIGLGACSGPVEDGAVVRADESAITNGTAGVDPHTVRIITTWETSDWEKCTGVLIAPRVVMTAAHCITPQRSWDTSVRWEDVAITSILVSSPTISERTVDLKAIRKHATYPNIQDNEGILPNTHDVALLRLSSEVTSLPDGSPLALTIASQPAALGRDQTYYVNGRKKDGVDVKSGANTYTWLTDRDDYTLKSVDNNANLDDRHCGSVTDSGDSGGPLFTSATGGTKIGTLYGVVSAAKRTNTSDEGWYARLDTIRSWIETTTQELH